MIPHWLLLYLEPSDPVMLCGGGGTGEDAKAAFHGLSLILVTDPCSEGLKVLRKRSLKYSVILNDLIPLAI